MPQVHVLLVDGFSDWEPALTLAGLHEYGRYEVVVVGLTDAPVKSMGGLKTAVDVALPALDPKAVETLLIPGSDLWTRAELPAVTALIQTVFANQGNVAAINGGTIAAGHAGLFRGHRHTSNRKSFLTNAVPSYDSEVNYVNELAVRDGRLITAAAIGYVEFARELFALLCVLSDSRLQDWYDLFRKAHPEAYAAFQKAS